MPQHHITLPKSSLNRFSNNGCFYYLDLNDLKIKKAFSKTYNTKKDYYPSHIEQYLSDEIETIMGRLNEDINNFVKNKGEFEINEDLKSKLVRFLAVQQIRNPDFVKNIRSQSIFGQIQGISDYVFSPLHKPDLKFINIAVNKFESILRDYQVNIAIISNESCSPTFLLTPTHCISFKDIIFVVVSPFYAFVLLPKEENQKYFSSDGIQKYIRIDTNEEFEPFLDSCINIANRFEKKHIIGYYDQLEMIKQKLCF